MADTVLPRSVLVERKATYARPHVFVGDEVYLCLPTASADSEVTCSIVLPNGERVPLDVRHRSTDLFSDHVAVTAVEAEGKHRYHFQVDGLRAGGSFVVKPAGRKRGKR